VLSDLWTFQTLLGVMNYTYIGISSDHFLPLATILTHIFLFLYIHKTLIHTRRFPALLTWPFSKTCTICWTNFCLGLPLQHCHPKPLHKSVLSISFHPSFLHDQTSQHILQILITTSSFTLCSSLITSFLTLSLNITPIIKVMNNCFVYPGNLVLRASLLFVDPINKPFYVGTNNTTSQRLASKLSNFLLSLLRHKHISFSKYGALRCTRNVSVLYI
jgi:hypothetical protein